MFTQLKPEPWIAFDEVYFSSRATQISFTFSGVLKTYRNVHTSKPSLSLIKMRSSKEVS